MFMEITNDYYESLLDDPQDQQVEQIEPEVEDVEEPLLPDQPSDTGEESNDSSNEDVQQDDDLITSYLKEYGITDPTKIQFENDEGGIDEVDFNSLPKEEQLTMLHELANSSVSDYDRQVLNFIHQNGGDLRAIVEQYQNMAIENYLAQNEQNVPQKTYSIDDYSVTIPGEYFDNDFDDVDIMNHFEEENQQESEIEFE